MNESSSTASKNASLPVGSVVIDNVSKRFRKRTLKRGYTTVKTSLLQRLFSGERLPENYVQALDNVSIHVPPGKSLGVIGRNGSGKSTLLKLIAGIYRTDEGRVDTRGRISALIELGAGFHPEFTGRENIFLGGVMYGLSRKEIEKRFDDIVGYAELEDFIDDPVKTYSSGMYMRLGFSLAVHTDPDILLIDEVLAVGDAAFIHRCQDTISEFRRRGKTLFFVTHDLSSVARWCDEAVWLDGGVVKRRGNPSEVIGSYLSAVAAGEEQALDAANRDRAEEQSGNERETYEVELDGPGRWGNRDVEILDVRLLNQVGQPHSLFHAGEEMVVEVDYTFRRPVEDLVFGIGLYRVDGLWILGTNTELESVAVPVPDFEQQDFEVLRTRAGGELRGTYRVRVPSMPLLENSYYLDVAAHRSDGLPYDYHHWLNKFSVRSSVQLQGVFHPSHEWDFAVNYPSVEAGPTKKAVGD